jgi:hypothetical protein
VRGSEMSDRDEELMELIDETVSDGAMELISVAVHELFENGCKKEDAHDYIANLMETLTNRADDEVKRVYEAKSKK